MSPSDLSWVRSAGAVVVKLAGTDSGSGENQEESQSPASEGFSMKHHTHLMYR